MHIKFLLVSLKGRNHLQELGIDGRMMIKWIRGKYGLEVWIRSILVRIVTRDEPL